MVMMMMMQLLDALNQGLNYHHREKKLLAASNDEVKDLNRPSLVDAEVKN
jgi:hypothetical protein